MFQNSQVENDVTELSAVCLQIGGSTTIPHLWVNSVMDTSTRHCNFLTCAILIASHVCAIRLS